MDFKAAQRDDARKIRRRIPAKKMAQITDQISASLINSGLIPDSNSPLTMHIYESQPKWNEVSTEQIRQWLLEQGHTVLEPLTQKTTDFENARNISSDETVNIKASTIDFIICPLVAFDPEGHRLGMGAGYYDRLLAAHPEATRIGLAPESAKIPSVLSEGHDELGANALSFAFEHIKTGGRDPFLRGKPAPHMVLKIFFKICHS